MRSLVCFLFLLLLSGITSCEREEERNLIGSYYDEVTFRANLRSNTIKILNFDTYLDGSSVPTGYESTGNWSGFQLNGNEWASIGITFSTPSGQHMSTVNDTEWPNAGDIIHNYHSFPNGLTCGQPPFVGYGVRHNNEETEDSLVIALNPPQDGVGLVFIDSVYTEGEHIEFISQDGSIIADFPLIDSLPQSFFGIISDTPIAHVKIFEDKYDYDDVAYDDIIFGTAKR